MSLPAETPLKILIVGSGFVGKALAAVLEGAGHSVVLASRHVPVEPEWAARWTQLDACDGPMFHGVVERVSPSAVVLVHGPSDISECERSPDAAWSTHTSVALNACRAVGPAYLLMISTDNVFDGRREMYSEFDQTAPFNAYGRAKFAAEELLRSQGRNVLIARTSLIYGREQGGRGWTNYFALALKTFAENRVLEVPDPLWNTPIEVADAARVYAACIAQGMTGLLHVAGPERISRLDWAYLVAEAFGFDRTLIRPVPASGSRYFCRPRNSCLNSIRLQDLLVDCPDIHIRSPREVARQMATAMLRGAVGQKRREPVLTMEGK